MDDTKFHDMLEFIGQKITDIKLTNETLIIGFGSKKLNIWDNGQDCCESRYMSTEDLLPYYVGSEFRGIEVRPGDDLPDGDVHEIEFLIIKTSLGEFVMTNHNENNGYYGGFGLALRVDNE